MFRAPHIILSEQGKIMKLEDKISLAAENAKNDPALKEMREEGQKMYLTALYDKRAGVYQNLTIVGATAYAVRGFIDAVKDENSALSKYPEDFRLVCLGTMNSKTGKIEQKELHEILLEATSVAVKK